MTVLLLLRSAAGNSFTGTATLSGAGTLTTAGTPTATGAAALGLGVYLAAAGLLADGRHDYVVEQGVEMGRPSTLRCQVEVVGGLAVRTSVCGGVVPIARGEIRVP